ncbi:MAG: protein-disulfide reductase DsbD [Steroidobacteraceae bacterium]|jgi:thiol:disulfide interchange protein DsbD
MACPGRVQAASATALDAVLDQSRQSARNDDFLPPELAFRLSASAPDAGHVRLDWIIAPGYYLYRDRIKILEDRGQTGTPEFPPGEIKSDEYFGKQVVYHNELIASVPVVGQAAAARALSLQVTYQGCAEAGLCYPPITRTLLLQLPGAGGSGAASPSGPSAAAYVSEQDRLAALIRSGNMLGVLGTFFGLGLLLAFTPCVLPMVPILSGLIAGAGANVSTARAFALSLTYVLGMALTYTATGAAFAAAGQQVQAAFQQPWIIVCFAALIVAMSLSMFGLYTLQMPAFVQTRLAELSNRQRAGHFGGVAIMGALSALIVTTCVAPPLVATLAVIGQSGDIARGAAALFAMSLGMGAPLLIVGSSAGRWLPRAGAWMDAVKRLFGVLMLAMAAWMLTRIVSPRVSLLLFAVPALAAAVVCWGLRGGVWLRRGGALLAALYAGALLLGAAQGANDPLHPWQWRGQGEPALPFRAVSTLADLHREVQAAATAHQAVMLDIDADWCVSCKEMERYTFTDPGVRQALQSVRLLRANVTANNAEDQALLREFHIFGPPTIAFYDAQGHEQQRFRVVGFMNAADFAALLHQAFAG